MALKQSYSFLKDTLNDHGLAEMLRAAWEGFRYSGETRKLLFALYEPRSMPDALEASRTHVFRFATKEDLTALAGTPQYEIAPIDIERVSKGIARCLLQLDGDNLVGYAWIWTNRLAYIDDGFHLNLPDDTIYNYKGYTNPAYRGYGYQALRHLNLLKLTRAEGVRRLFGFVDHFNTKSLRGVRKSGYVQVGQLRIRHKKGKVRLVVEVEEHFWSSASRT
jgi:RimJ/RimL family protein N-acetyltransferase